MCGGHGHRYGISVRAAVSRLKTAYEVYGMPSRTKGSMKAWHVRQQKGKSPTKFRVAQRHGAMRSMLTGMEQRRPMVNWRARGGARERS